MSSSCPICCDDFSVWKPGIEQRCCGSVLCRDCLYSHIKSILEEGLTGEGRKDLTCPFGCKAGESCVISDLAVRDAFRARHPDLARFVIGRPLYNICSWLGVAIPAFRERAVCFYRFAQSVEERNDLHLYEKWSLSTALSHKIVNHDDETGEAGEETMDATHVYVHVIRCPRPDCECLWLANEPYRKKKLNNERQFNKEKRHDEAPKAFAKSLMLSCSSFFFKPIPPEKEESMMNQNGGYTTEHWMNPIDIDLFGRQSKKNKTGSHHRAIPRDGEQRSSSSNKDGRMVQCPACDHRFCGLCSRPWTTLSNSSGARVTHTGRLCSMYAQRASDDDDFLRAAEAGDAKFCPGCSMRTNRTDGCNHMTCPCGYEWCYICECRWDRRHYKCKDGDAIGGGSPTEGNCVIS